MSDFQCPSCRGVFQMPFRWPCQCGFDVRHLDGTSPSPFQVEKFSKHTAGIQSGTVTLADGRYNASFTYTGALVLPDLVRFTVGFGEPAVLPGRGGRASSEVRVAYVPWVIGEGVSIYQPGTVPCSGLCIVSPQSVTFGHPYPVLDAWVRHNFSGQASVCRLCRRPTAFAETICAACFGKVGSDWRSLL